MPCDTRPRSERADPDDVLSQWAAWGNPRRSLLTPGTAEDSWAHIKLSHRSHVKTNERVSCELSLFSSASETMLNQEQILLKIVISDRLLLEPSHDVNPVSN